MKMQTSSVWMWTASRTFSVMYDIHTVCTGTYKCSKELKLKKVSTMGWKQSKWGSLPHFSLYCKNVIQQGLFWHQCLQCCVAIPYYAFLQCLCLVSPPQFPSSGWPPTSTINMLVASTITREFLPLKWHIALLAQGLSEPRTLRSQPT